MKRFVLVDGYNIILRDPVLAPVSRRSLQTAREALLARLLSSYDLRACDVTVVFDGQGANETTDRWGKIRVVYSRSGQSADEVIARLVTETKDPSQLVVLSDDRSVRGSATQAGGIAAGSADRRQPTLAAKANDPDAPPARAGNPKKGNPRRAPKPRRDRGDGFRW